MIGKPNEEELEAILETLPIEFSVLNKNDEVLAWNKHETRIFKRQEAAIGRNVKQCHPPKSVDKVEKIISEMKEGKRDFAEFWINLPIGEAGSERKILIRYFALRNKDGRYLGCLEASMDITDIQKIRGEKRLLD